MESSMYRSMSTASMSEALALSAPSRKNSTASQQFENNTRKINTSTLLYNSNYANTCSQESIISTMDRFLTSVNNMNSVVMVPSKLYDLEEEEPAVSSSSSSSSSSEGNTSLYSAFKMLVEAKEDIVWRSDSLKEKDFNSEAKQFKHHLEGLNQLLNQFADLADHLATRYQSDTGIAE